MGSLDVFSTATTHGLRLTRPACNLRAQLATNRSRPTAHGVHSHVHSGPRCRGPGNSYCAPGRTSVASALFHDFATRVAGRESDATARATSGHRHHAHGPHPERKHISHNGSKAPQFASPSSLTLLTSPPPHSLIFRSSSSTLPRASRPASNSTYSFSFPFSLLSTQAHPAHLVRLPWFLVFPSSLPLARLSSWAEGEQSLALLHGPT